MKNIEPCKVCGSTDANLIDGFYYCVECGTQDVNVRETVVEEMQLADGTISYKQRKKIYKAAEEDDNLSGEWHRWHAYNFILVGLADEMIAIGAKQTFKKKLLWLWAEYMKKFQNRKELGLNTEGEENHQNNNEDGSDSEEVNGFYDEELFKKNKRRFRYKKLLKMNALIQLDYIKKGHLFSLIYIALQLDRNDFHFSDLLRFIKQGYFDIENCEKYVPKEIKTKAIPDWGKFRRSHIWMKDMEVYIMSIYKCLKVVPLVPDLKVLVHRYAKELCLPNDFKNLVFSLIHLLPCDYLKLEYKDMRSLGRIPLYECIVMSYFLVAFKMLFGLDDDYELRLSDAVEKINDDNCHLKSYNLGSGDSEPTDRLFSFREWCNFIQLRKLVLCKNYRHMAEHYDLPVDDYVFMEQDHQKKAEKKPTLSDEITMKLLDRIPQIAAVAVIPSSEFKASVTPLASASEVVLQYFNDPDLKLLFSEDFTQYSLKYATEKLYLNDNEENPRNVVVGVSAENKIINHKVVGTLDSQKFDIDLVYVRNCENKNWLKTNQPSIDHVKKVEPNSDKESDHGYDSNAENASTVEISSNDTVSVIDNMETHIEQETRRRDSSAAENASVLEISIKNNTNYDDSKETNFEEKTVVENASNLEISTINETYDHDSTELDFEEEKPDTHEGDSKLGISSVEIVSSNNTRAGSETPIQEEIKKELETIEEEAFDQNIFDDDFADIVDVKSEPDEKVEPEQFDFDHPGEGDGNEQHIDHSTFPSTSANQDDAQSQISMDESELFFNENTFDREKTIRELILATCKKYKISIPEEYRTKEPQKRKSKFIQDGAGESRPKKQKLDDGTTKKRPAKRGNVKDEINNLLASYYENLQRDVLFQISEHVKSVVNNISRTNDTNNADRIQDESTHLENITGEPNVADSMNDQIHFNAEVNPDPADAHENIEINSSTLESSVQVIDGETHDTQPIVDPRFDDKEYDPKQLYVKVVEETEIEDVYNVADDPEIAAILDKKIEEIDKGEVNAVSQPKKVVNYESDEENIPLSVLRAEKEEIFEKNRKEDNLPPLLRHEHVKEFNYWTRQYQSDKLRRAHELIEQFYIELDKNFPKNFSFVLKECADVIGYSPFRLYRTLMDLERRLLCYNNINN
ncbi:hypothetical protein ABMA28_009922 [Loxostege sticticalis]|uniref:TATA box-binding protein-associated factor RNA polymerase I subunit B n=1 Tax=Loxostege sticticalis TaxID=481309 RepID=A0ABD0SBV0_LOXSC